MTPIQSTTLAPSPSTGQATGLVAVDGRSFPLRSTRIAARAEGGLAATTLVQEYANPHAEPLEVLYTMPLPADGAAIGYTVHLGERVIRGVVESREQAQKAYRQALAEGRTAGLLEQQRADTFTQKLGNLPPGADARVEIEVLQPLAFVAQSEAEGDACWEYRFPTVVGVRYQGEPGRVSDADELDATRADKTGTPVRLEIDLQITDGKPEGIHAASSSHDIAVTGEGDTTRVRLAAASRLDRDLVVRWRGAGGDVGLQLVEGRGLEGDSGRYGLLTITPPAAPKQKLARDLTILLDASGSMSGMPLEQAKYVAKLLLASLVKEDRVEVLAFAGRVTPLSNGPVHATKRKLAKIVNRLDALQAGGCTEMVQALIGALEPLRRDSQRQVVLMTDGYIGFEGEVVSQVLKGLPAEARLHTVGVGAAPNRTLTHAAARAGRGLELFVGTDAREDAETAGRRLCQATVAPVLTNVSVKGTAIAGLAPERPSDVFAGRPTLVALELRGDGGWIEVEGSLAGSDEPWRERVNVEAAGAGVSTALPLGAFYGRERVEDCEMRLAAGREGRAGSERIEKLGLRHRIVTRATSLVAISEDTTVDPQDPRRREKLSVEMPAGVSAEGVGLMPGVAYDLMMAQVVRDGDVHDLGLPVKGARFSVGSVLDGKPRRRRRTVPREIRAEGFVVHSEDRLIVLEIEVPSTGLTVPKDGHSLTVRFLDDSMGIFRLIGDLSTKPGKYEPGFVVRIALRLDADDVDQVRRIEWGVDKTTVEISVTRPPKDKE